MVDLIVGYRTDVIDGRSLYFLLEMEAEDYIYQDRAIELRDFLNETTDNIVDEVVFVVDGYSGEVIWEA